MPADEQLKRSPERGRSAVQSGTLTGLSFLMVSGAAAVAGAYLAHKFGRDVRTDGFMAAYGVYLVLVLGAQSFRMVVVPDLTRADGQGLVSLAWGLALNAVLAVALPAAALVARGGRVRRGSVPLELRRRLGRLMLGAAVPLAVQGIYVIGLRFAAGTGTGNVTSLSYAYLLAAMFVSATAFSLSLIAAAPLTRRGVDAESAADHVVHTAWVALAFVGAATGLVALVGGRVVTAALGHAYAGKVGDQLGQLVVYLSPWMVAWAAFS